MLDVREAKFCRRRIGELEALLVATRKTGVTTALGMVLMLRALIFDRCVYTAGTRIEDTASWVAECSSWSDQRDRVLLETVFTVIDQQNHA